MVKQRQIVGTLNLHENNVQSHGAYKHSAKAKASGINKSNSNLSAKIDMVMRVMMLFIRMIMKIVVKMNTLKVSL